MIALFRSLFARITRRRRPQRGIRTLVAVRDGKWDDPATWRVEPTSPVVFGKATGGSASAKYARPIEPKQP
jgi:hypothetical protein